MIERLVRYTCDRCGKVVETDYGCPVPSGWGYIEVKSVQKFLCPNCNMAYDDVMAGFIGNKFNDTESVKKRTYTIGVPNTSGSISTVECSLETEDLSKQGLIVTGVKYKVAKVDYSDNLALRRIEYYDDAEKAVSRYFKNNVGLNLVLKIVQCKDAEGKTAYKWYEWDAYGPTHGFVPTDGRFGD